MTTDQEIPQELAVEESTVHPKKKKESTAAFKAFAEQFEKDQTAEEKLRVALDFMRASLSQTGNPRFEDFWGAKKLSLPLFKETLNPKSRAQFWAEYIELSSEARRVKEILDEQSAFAVEQIELAILALEKDIELYSELVAGAAQIAFPEGCDDRRGIYGTLQKELHLLNTLASRVNGMRKEVIKTGMRIRQKTKFFERLSTIGDQIFPKRKELIKQISEQFCQDVEAFIQREFKGGEQEEAPLFVLREEIKALQALAKVLTLNTHAFTETRLKLSECWDQLKEKDKERKKEFAQKKLAFKENFDLVMEKIKPFAENCALETASFEESSKAADEILSFMRTIQLGREEVRILKDEIAAARKPLFDKRRAVEDQERARVLEIEKQKKEKIQGLKDKIAAMLSDLDNADVEKLTTFYEEFTQSLTAASITKSEKMLLDKSLKQLKDAIVEKKEKALLNLSADDLQTLENLKTLLAQRNERRKVIKDQLESYRRALGGSGFDFEKAMMYREMIEEERERLEKAHAAVEEIEEKIAEIEDK